MADSTLSSLSKLLGTWITEATHPAMPGVVVHGSVSIEWLEGERFLIHRARNDHPDFPDSISVIGHTDQDRADTSGRVAMPQDGVSNLSMHYFDSRGVFRVYQAAIDATALRFWREAPGFSQRFVGPFQDAGDTIAGRWEVCEDDVNWSSDLEITYRRTTNSR